DEWLLPGLWIFDGSGNLQSQVDVNFNCNFGSKLQTDVICVYGGSACDQTIAPNPGDVIEAVYVQNATTAYGEIIDHTQGTSAVVTGTLGGSTIVLVGDKGPSSFGVTSVPTFKKVPFKTGTVNGFYLGDWGPTTLALKTATHVQIQSTGVPTTNFVTT